MQSGRRFDVARPPDEVSATCSRRDRPCFVAYPRTSESVRRTTAAASRLVSGSIATTLRAARSTSTVKPVTSGIVCGVGTTVYGGQAVPESENETIDQSPSTVVGWAKL